MPFGLTIFLSAFLVFQLQPIIGKAVLPWFGGGSAVWTICMLFFQCQLLAGYAYAHLIATRLSARAQRRAQLGVIAIAIGLMVVQLAAGNSPILPATSWQPGDPSHPIGHLLALLACTIGLPYLALAATGPLIQSWFARARPTTSPYRLYALSNAGSLLALVSYPFVIEPNLSLHTQAIVWSIGFSIFAIGTAIAARVPEAVIEPAAIDRSVAAPARTVWLVWLVAPACASMMLLAITNELCLDVAPIPFLWVLPLAIYLLSFVLCFQSDRFYRRGIFGPLLAISLAAVAYIADGDTPSLKRAIVVYGVALFAVCMPCHGELARTRPAPRWLTAYLLTVAAGGALGGIFVGIVAPLIFSGYWELYIAIVLAAVLAIVVVARDERSWLRAGAVWPAIVVCGGAIGFAAYVRGDPWLDAVVGWPARSPLWIAVKLACACAIVIATRRWLRICRPWIAAGCLTFSIACLGLVLLRDAHELAGNSTSRRGFYGVLSVVELDHGLEHERLLLYHGQTIHGAQYQAAKWRDLPTTYYASKSGIWRAIVNHPDRTRPLRIGVVGLGTGTIAALARAGDTLRFYDIDPDVVALSRGSRPVFTYVADSPGTIDIVLGDARLSLEHEPPQRFDVLVIDAFSGDSIPVHLLTREGVAAELAQLGADGLLVVHISNQYLDLEPVLAGHAATFGLAVAVVDVDEDDTTWGSTWVVLARDRELLRRAGLEDDTRQLRGDPVSWTDEESNLLRILR